MNGDKNQLRAYGIQLARYGFVTVCCEYRLSGEAFWPAQIHDCKAALRWMRANANTLGLDPDRIAVSGNSAGAHLSLLLGRHLITPNLRARAVIAIYPPTHLKGGGELDSAVNQLFGDINVSQEVRDRASPITWSRESFPPTMLVHGNNDKVVPVSETLNMYDQL